MKYVTHLGAGTYERLLRGDLPAEEARAIARHLEEPCETCEAFLAGLPGDGLDGRVETALRVFEPAGPPGNDLEFARIERRLREGPPADRKPGRIVAGVAAAALLVAGVAGLLAPRPREERPAWDGLKGTAAAIPVRLRFLVLSPGPGGRLSIEKGIPGQAVGTGSSLQFEVETARPAALALLRVGHGGEPEVFWKERVGAGKTPVSAGGRPAAYPLSDLSGPQRFVLVAAGEGLDERRLLAAAAALAPPGRPTPDLPALEGLSLDVLDVEVR